jgi:hypothetical protein
MKPKVLQKLDFSFVVWWWEITVNAESIPCLILEPLLVSTNIFGSGFRNFVPSFLEKAGFSTYITKSFETARLVMSAGMDFDEKEAAILNTSSKNQKEKSKQL